MIQVIPLIATPSQKLTVSLSGQLCAITVYQKLDHIYLDLRVLNRPLVTAAICRDRVDVVRHGYLGFIGSLAICDTQGVNDPEFSGLGSRYLLTYTT